MDPSQLMELDYSNRAPTLVGVMIAGLALCLPVILMRFYVRLHIVRKTGWDDWTVLLSFIFLLIAYSLLGSATIYGLGRHTATVAAESSPAQVSHAMKLVWVAFQFTPSAEALGKISVALMLMRITTSKKWKYFLSGLIVLDVGFNIGMMFSILMACWPVTMLWDPTVPGHCNLAQRNVMTYFQGGSAALSDLVLAVAPVILLWGVQIDMQSKLLLCGLLGLGLLTAAAGCVRIGYSYTLNLPETALDPTWIILDFIIWKTVELSLSVIVGCLPVLRPLFSAKSFSRRDGSGPSYKLDSSRNTDRSKNMRINKTTEISVNEHYVTSFSDKHSTEKLV